MPTVDCLRLHNNKCALPSGPETPQCDLENAMQQVEGGIVFASSLRVAAAKLGSPREGRGESEGESLLPWR